MKFHYKIRVNYQYNHIFSHKNINDKIIENVINITLFTIQWKNKKVQKLTIESSET